MLSGHHKIGMLPAPSPKRIKCGAPEGSHQDDNSSENKRYELISKAALAVLKVHSDLKEMRKEVGLEVEFMPLCFNRTYTGPEYKMNMCVGMSSYHGFPPPRDSIRQKKK